MAEIFVGCAGFTGSRESYWKSLDLVELTETFHGMPKARLLRRSLPDPGSREYRVVVTANQVITHPPGDPALRLSAEAPPEGPFGLLRDTPAVREAWEAMVKVAEGLDAWGVILRTPPAFTPSAANREALAAFAERARADLGERRLIWEPTGLWEPEDAAELAMELGLVRAVDPLRDEPDPIDVGYFRLRGLIGARRRYSDEDLEDLLEHAEDFEQTFIIFDYNERLQDALRLSQILRQE